jgi:hypothetical protein
MPCCCATGCQLSAREPAHDDLSNRLPLPSTLVLAAGQVANTRQPAHGRSHSQARTTESLGDDRAVVRNGHASHRQSVATSSAPQIARIRESLSRPSRSTSVEGMVGVRGCVGRVDLGCTVAAEERGERLVDEFGIACHRARLACMFEKPLIDRRAQTRSCHATTMPLLCHMHNGRAASRVPEQKHEPSTTLG